MPLTPSTVKFVLTKGCTHLPKVFFSFGEDYERFQFAVEYGTNYPTDFASTFAKHVLTRFTTSHVVGDNTRLEAVTSYSCFQGLVRISINSHEGNPAHPNYSSVKKQQNPDITQLLRLGNQMYTNIKEALNKEKEIQAFDKKRDDLISAKMQELFERGEYDIDPETIEIEEPEPLSEDDRAICERLHEALFTKSPSAFLSFLAHVRSISGTPRCTKDLESTSRCDIRFRS